MAESQQKTDFQCMVRASGLAEIWTHNTDSAKFNQFGWRCTNKENSFANETLVGNWSEERFDIKKLGQAKPLPSQYDHYFDTTYDLSYDNTRHQVPQDLKNLKDRHSHAYPSHQPELDHPSLKGTYNSWKTSAREAYVDPKRRMAPIGMQQ